ncbi:MAG: AI-2E family transporter [Elusimicrobia bacterium]|nr:AI-2E family transporter [Elusimicrobiota bacterium]
MSNPFQSRIPEIQRRQLFRYFFFGVFAFLLYQLLQVLSPFITALIWSATLTLIFYPIHDWLSKKGVKQRHTAAFLSTNIVVFTVIVPFLLLLWSLVRESAELYPIAKEWLENVRSSNLQSPDTFLPSPLLLLWRKVEPLFGILDIDIQGTFLRNLNQIGQAFADLGKTIAKNLFFLIVNLLILLVSLFFFFKDGAALIHWLLDLIPMEHNHKQHIATRLYETLTAVVRGVTITAASQGILAGLGFAAAGVPLPFFLGFATAFAALVPPLGPALIWLPTGLYYLTQSKWVGIFLLVWGGGVVSTIDNILRPILIGDKAKLPILLLFFGIMGGMRVYGFLGLILGPILIACTLAFIQIYREEYHQSKSTKQRD